MESRTPESNRNCGVVCLARSPFDFWIQSDQNKTKYTELISDLKSIYSTANDASQLVREPVIGGIYCVLNSKLYEWQRCEILQISNNKEAYIVYIDVGNRDFVSISALRQLSENVKYIPRLAIHCSLDGIKPTNGESIWSSQAIQTFSKLVLAKTVTFVIKSKDTSDFKIDLFVKSVNVGEQLCHDQLAERHVSPDANLLTRSKTFENQQTGMIEELKSRFVQSSIIENEEREVIVTCVYSPFCFYAQLAASNDEFKRFEETMQAYLIELVNKSEAVFLLEPRVGQMCVAKFSEDGLWYRAVIKDLAPASGINQAVVFFVDYGNEDTVTLDSQSLIAIHDRFKDFPSAAFKCCLEGVKPLDEQMALSANVNMSRLADVVYETVQSGASMAKFLSKSLDDGYLVDLTVITNTQRVNLRQALLDQKLVSSTADNRMPPPPLPRKQSSNPQRQINQLVSDLAVQNSKMPTTRTTMENLADPNQSHRFKEYVQRAPRVDPKLSQEFWVTHVETLGEFYVRVESGDFRKFHCDLQYFYAKKSNLPGPMLKADCACVFYNDTEKWWERARIVSVVDEDHCLVKLIDRGDTKFSHKSSLRVIHDKFLIEPCQAIKASLSDLQPNEEISEEANERFKTVALNNKFLAKITSVESGEDGYVNKLILNLFDENQDSVYLLLVQELDTSKNVEQLNKFKPTVISDMDETLNNTFSPVVNHVVNQPSMPTTSSSKPSPLKQPIDPRILMSQDTSPFPVHEENFVHRQRPEQPMPTQPTLIDANKRVFNNLTNGYAKETLLTPVNQVVATAAVAATTPVNQVAAAAVTVTTPVPSVDQVDSQRQLKRPTELQLDNNLKVQKPQIKIAVNNAIHLAYYKAVTFDKIVEDTMKPHAGTISYLESIDSFWFQIKHLFAQFDSQFEQFQKSCANRNYVKIDLTEFKKTVAKDEANTLALAAKFYEDQTWYRGRLVKDDRERIFDFNDGNDETNPSVWIEFIDYGNRQKTRLSDCVYLSERFVEYKACAVKCAAVAYLNEILKSNKIDTHKLESLLIEGKAEKQVEPTRYEFETYFKVQGDKVLAEIDSFYANLYRNGLIPMSYQLDPAHYNERILRQANVDELNALFANPSLEENSPTATKSQIPIRQVEAKLVNMDSLEYMYFNLVSTLKDLNKLEKQLLEQKDSELVPILESKDLQMNVFYLIKYENRLYRGILITSDIAKLVDYGRTIHLKKKRDESPVMFYKLMPKYFKHGTYSLHGRLPMSNAIQKVWTDTEREKFASQMEIGSLYHIKLFNTYEPYMFEFNDINQKIEFKFDQIINRVLSSYSTESQCLVKGCRLVFHEEDFFLGGNMFKVSANSHYKLETQSQSSDSGTFHDKKMYIYTNSLFEKLIKFQKLIENLYTNISASNKKPPVESLTKSHIYLTKTSSEEFLSSIQIPRVRDLIAGGYSRVRVNKLTKNNRTGYRYVHITYLDYGLEDVIKYQETVSGDVTFATYSNYKFFPIFGQLLLWPTFSFECRLDKSKLVDKLHTLALKENSFLDPDYINTKMDDIGSVLNSIPLRVELITPPLVGGGGKQAEEQPFVVDLYDKKTNKNIIDIIFENALQSISNFMFECFIVHVNSVEDFYIQKQDSFTKETLNSLQEKIQAKVKSCELKPIQHVELNKLCVAYFHDDQQFYRAKVIGVNETVYNVFYIDYGNTSYVDKNQLREISADLVDDLPKSFAINCKLKMFYEEAAKYRELVQKGEQLTQYLFDILDTSKFLVKCLERRKEVKYDDSFVYLVELFDADSQTNLIEMFLQREAEMTQINKTNLSCVEMTFSQSMALSNSGDDRAIATDLTSCQEVTTSNQTHMNGELTELTRMETEMRSIAPQAPQIQQNGVLSRQPSLEDSNDHETWNETPSEFKNFNRADEITHNATTTQNDDLYSTANESRLGTDENEEFVELKDCIISFFHSEKDFFVQSSDFESKMAALQPQIDECLDPFDLSVSPLCVGKYDGDELFYRMRVLEWAEPKSQCLLIDYGNKELVGIEWITAMMPELANEPPLAINCFFKDLENLTACELSMLVEIVSRELIFDCKLKRSDLNKFYQDPSQLCPVELFFSATGQKLDQQILNDQDAVNKIALTQHQNQSPHPVVTIDEAYGNINEQKQKRRRIGSWAYKQLDDFNLQKETTMNKTDGTDIRMYLYHPPQQSMNFDGPTIDDDECLPSLSLSRNSIKSFAAAADDASTCSSHHPKNLTVSRSHDTQNWSLSFNGESDTTTLSDHPNYEAHSVIKDETTWLSEKTRAEMDELDQTSVSRRENKNETVVERRGEEDSNWVGNSRMNETKDDETVVLNETVPPGHESTNWTLNNNSQSVTESMLANKNTTVNKAEQSSMWSEASRLSDRHFKERSKSFNGEAINNMHPPLPDVNNRQVFYREPRVRSSETESESQSTTSDELLLHDDDLDEETHQVTYQDFIVGNMIAVKTLENFYIQRAGADNDLMQIKAELDKLQLKSFDKVPAVGTLCICRYHVDNQLYRAEIIENHDVTRLRVFFIDYGNEDNINIAEIFRMEPVLRKVKSLAENCQLYFTDTFNEIVKRLRPDDAEHSNINHKNHQLFNQSFLSSGGLSITNRLIKCFKILTAKSKVIARVRKELTDPSGNNNYDPTYQRKRNLVDLFLVPQNYEPKKSVQSTKERNILDDLLLETVYLLVNDPRNVISLNTQVTRVNDQEFVGYVTNLKHFQKAHSLQFQVQSMTFIRMINKLIEIFQPMKNRNSVVINHTSDNQIETNKMCLVRLPQPLISKFYHNEPPNSLFYARALILNSDKITCSVNLVDYNYQTRVNTSELIRLNTLQADKVFNLIPVQTNFYTLMLSEQINTFIHVNLAVSNINYLFELFKTMLNYEGGFSSIFKFECKSQERPFAALITDPTRQQLSVNKLFELSVACITSPFIGTVTNTTIDNKNNQSLIEFECLHELSKNKSYMSELSKVLNSTGLFDESDEESDITTRSSLEVGQFCIIDLTPAQKSSTSSSDSILSMTNLIDPDAAPSSLAANTSCLLSSSSRELYRAVVLEHFQDKYLVLNLESGKKCSLARKRVKWVTNSEHVRTASCLLAQMIPSLLIRVSSSVTSFANLDAVKSTLHNSRFYGHKISLHFSQDVWQRTTDSSSCLIQRDHDLYKLVNSIDQNVMNENSAMAAGVSMMSSSQQIDVSKYYSLVHVDSFDHFYIQSSEASVSIVGQIEKRIEQEYATLQDACLVSTRKCPPSLHMVYAVRWSRSKKFARVRLLSAVPSLTSNNDFYRALFLDHGFMDTINLQDLIFVSEQLQRIPPQAICCKLYGQQQLQNKETNAAAERADKLEFFRCLMKNKRRLFASIYKEYSINRRITNYIPLQADNTRPIEVILHIMSEDGLAFTDLNDVLTKLVESNKRPAAASVLKFKPYQVKLGALLADRNELKSVEVMSIHSIHKFIVRLTNSKLILDKLSQEMSREYESLIVNQKSTSLRVQELQKGLPCAFVENGVARRALIVDFKPYQPNEGSVAAHDSSTIDIQVKIYLIDMDLECSLINTASLYPMLDKYLSQEPLCFECSLCSDDQNSEHHGLPAVPPTMDSMMANLDELKLERFKQIVNSCKYLKIKALGVMTKKGQNGFNKYYVSLYGSHQATSVSSEQEMINVNEAVLSGDNVGQLKQIKVELSDSVISSSSSSTLPTIQENNKYVRQVELNNERSSSSLSSLVYVSTYLEKSETEFRQGAVFKVQLTNLDTANQLFSIVLSSDSAKRLKFLNSFHVWHKENRSSLRLVYGDGGGGGGSRTMQKCIGLPCAFNSTLYVKWTRGVIVTTDFSAGQSIVFAVDYSRNFVVGHERLYVLENQDLLNEPIYSYRCIAQDEKEQREKLQTYIELIKTGKKSETTTTGGGQPNNLLSSPSPAAPHLSIENFELEIKIIDKELSPLFMDQMMYSLQYVVRIVDIRRIKSPFSSVTRGQMPLLSTNSPVGCNRLLTISPASPLSANILLKNYQTSSIRQMYSDNFSDQSIENKLSSQQEEHSVRASAASAVAAISTTANHLSLDRSKIARSKSPQTAGENDEENMTFNAITESTRIYQSTATMNENHDISEVMIPPSQMSITNHMTSRNNGRSRRSPLDSEQKIEEETSKWIREETSKSFDTSDTSKLNETGDLKPSQRYRVRLAEKPKLTSKYLLLERVDLKNSYERLKAAMSAYYEKIANASRSLERTSSLTSSLFFSSSSNSSSNNTLFTHKFNVGDHCAAFVGNKVKSWSRCVVLVVDEISKKAWIECVDDAQRHIVPLDKLEKLNDSFKTLCKYVFRARIADRSKPPEITARVIHQKGVFNLELTAEIVSSGEDIVDPQIRLKSTIYDINLYLPDKRNLFE